MARISPDGFVEMGFFVIVDNGTMSIRTDGVRPGSITTTERMFGPFYATFAIGTDEWAEIKSALAAKRSALPDR